MGARPELKDELPEALPAYRRILLAADSSDHADRGATEAALLAQLFDAQVTGTHVYAAKMHDVRFRQMEGGLPEQFREEQELERQRDVHDDLITRGLSVITDSYLDQVEKACRERTVRFHRQPLEGKNYRALVEEANSGKYDLLVLGALGLGAIEGARLGTVCQRVARRSEIDTLVIKDPHRGLADGPIVVAVDGSSRAYGGLLTALALADHWSVPVKVVAAFDPYYHYVAFNRIAGVLSEEAGKVFRFKEQEKLHEEIIDSGLARIYEGHLQVAESIAGEHGVEVETALLDGKPHDAVERYLRELAPSLLVIGKLGIHADPELDIGGNAENLLRNADCSVLLSQRQYRPPVDRLAEVTTSWTTEAERRMGNVPSFVRDMARMAILRYAQERGHTVITERIVEEATARLMPARAEEMMREIVSAHDQIERDVSADTLVWTSDATALLDAVEDSSVRQNARMRAEKKARTAGVATVGVEHVQQFVADSPRRNVETAESHVHWEATALARLARVPEGFMRDATRQRIETYAHEHGISRISLDVAERGLAEARRAMQGAMQGQQAGDDDTSPRVSKCPFANPGGMSASTTAPGAEPTWSEDAESRLLSVPDGFCRDMTRRAASTIAAQSDITRIDGSFVDHVMSVFKLGSQGVAETMPWEDDARARIARAPDAVRGMLVKEIEAWAQRNARDEVDAMAVAAVKQAWQERGVFHLDPADPRNDD
jgi:nucleotide-binding universal stress UspA family protein